MELTEEERAIYEWQIWVHGLGEGGQAKLKASLEHAERSDNAREADRLRKALLELDQYEHDVLYPLASQTLAIDLDEGVKMNYAKFGAALSRIPGLEATE